jgi:hypothetical protein
MAKDLIIGGASNYSWRELQYWVNSIKKTGFKGDIVLVATNISGETVQKLSDEGVFVHAYGESDANGNVTNKSNNAPHVERFIFIWDYLNKNLEDYRYVVVTDTRDVIFQKDPIEFLDRKLGLNSLVCSSEGLLYQDEPWGNKNLLDTFGPIVYNELKDKLIYNVGTIAGYYEEVRDLLLHLFFNSVNRPIPIVDQAVFNFMINFHPYVGGILKTNNESDWAVQLGTTKYAVEAGKGDLGAAGNMDKYLQTYQDIQPKIENGRVSNGHTEYCIVHQWDRVPTLKAAIEKEYGDGECPQILTFTT